jgi:hypothetical protein
MNQVLCWGGLCDLLSNVSLAAKGLSKAPISGTKTSAKVSGRQRPPCLFSVSPVPGTQQVTIRSPFLVLFSKASVPPATFPLLRDMEEFTNPAPGLLPTALARICPQPLGSLVPLQDP